MYYYADEGPGGPDLHFRPVVYCHQIFYKGFISTGGGQSWGEKGWAEVGKRLDRAETWQGVLFRLQRDGLETNRCERGRWVEEKYVGAEGMALRDSGKDGG